VRDLADRAKVNQKTIKTFWHKMQATKAKSVLTKENPYEPVSLPKKKSLLKPKRRTGYGQYKKKLRKEHTCRAFQMNITILRANLDMQ